MRELTPDEQKTADEMKDFLLKRFPNCRVTDLPGKNCVTPHEIREALLEWDMRKELIVTIDSEDPKKIHVQLSPNLISEFRILRRKANPDA